MSFGLLDAIRTERSALEERLAILERMEADAARFYDLPANPAPPPAERSGADAEAGPRAAPRPRTAPLRRGERRERIRDHVLTHGPIGRGALIRALGGDVTTVKRILKSLVEGGEIRAIGENGQRVYDKPLVAAEPVLLPRVLLGRREPIPARGDDVLYDAIAELAPASTVQLVERTGLPPSTVNERGRALLRRGLVHVSGRGAGRAWRLAPRDPRAEIEQLITAGGAPMTDEQIARMLRLGREQVDSAVAELLDTGTVVRHGDAYAPAARTSRELTR